MMLGRIIIAEQMRTIKSGFVSGLKTFVRNARQIVERNKEGAEIRRKIEESGKKSLFKVVK